MTGDSLIDEASVTVSRECTLPLLVSLSSLELDVEPEDTCRISIGDVPTMLCAWWTCWLDVARSAIGDEI